MPPSVPWCWEQLLSAEERFGWFSEKKLPGKLTRVRGKSRPGVYRFIFPEQVDGTARHTPCYVGEAGDLGERLQCYFRATRHIERRNDCDELILDDAWKVRGSIQKSGGCFSLEVLRIKNFIKLPGVVINEHSLEDPFARRLLENLTLLYALQHEGLHPLNMGVSQGARDFWRKAKAARNESGS
jgi:hypothetical protein